MPNIRSVGFLHFFLVVLMASVSSCTIQCPSITAYTEYISRKNLASYYIGTPDPADSYPTVGQRLRVKWAVPSAYCLGELQLKIRIRFYNQEELEKELSLESPTGVYEYSILNEDYFCKNGIQAYFVELLLDGVVVDNWRHQLWVEKILFEDDSK